jgi:8-oxo-dGTP pyrophosphatase MutT (NUDIX family)
MIKSLPIIIQSIVYRERKQDFEFLLLKRSADRGNFWNVVNGTLEFEESIKMCRDRELFEEAGIENVLSWSDEINRFNFAYKGESIMVIAYSAEVAANQRVIINDEHAEYRWVCFEDALNMLKFDDDKNGLRKLYDKINKSV